MSGLVPTSVTENYMVPSKHEIHSAFTEGARDFLDRYDELELEQQTAKTRAVFKATELDHTATTATIIYDHTGDALRRAGIARKKLRMDASVGGVLLFAAVLLALTVVAVGGVDFSILYDLFSAKFADRFGDVPAESVGLLGLFALQGVLAMLAYKVVLSSERRLKMAGLAALTMLLIYGLGLLLDQGFEGLAKATVSTTNRLGFGLQPAPVAAPDLQPIQIFSIFALGIPLVLLPLVGGLFAALAQRLIYDGITRQIEWRHFRDDHQVMKDQTLAAESARHQMNQLTARRQEIVQAPAKRQIDEAFAYATQLLDLTSRAQMAGDTSISVPGPGGSVITNIELAKAIAVQARNTLEGYLQREFTNWTSTNPEWRN